MKLLLFLLCFTWNLQAQVKAKPILEIVLASNKRDTVCLQQLTVAEFKYKLHQLETGNLKHPYQAVNKYGYAGKYQLSKYYINKYSGTTREAFLRSPWRQEVTMNRLVANYLNFIQLHDWDDLYIGTEINGITVTLEGLMAGYHQHPIALKKWLESGGKIDLEDGNNCKVSTFLKHFDYL